MKLLVLVLMLVATWGVKGAAVTGKASWYGDECRGKPMANRKPFNPEALTCASWFYPLGTKLRVMNLQTYQTVDVVVTDRGPHRRFVRQGRIIDLSKAAFAQIEPLPVGLVRVKVSRLP